MRPFTDSAPKHLYPFHGRPFAEWLVEGLADQGFERILFLLGYLPEATRRHFGERRWRGIEIDYAKTPEEWETAARLGAAVDRLDPEFLLCYGDNIWPLRMLEAWQAWQRSRSAVQLVVYDNSDGYSRANVRVEDGWVRQYDPTRSQPGLGAVDIGYALVSRQVVAGLSTDVRRAFGAAVYPALAARGELSALMTRHRYYGPGSPERLEATAEFLANRPALLVDRDGVLNERRAPGDYVRNWSEWRWLPGACEALARFHRAGYRVAVVTNQAGVALGALTSAALDDIHARLRADVEAAGGRIDAIFVCPHHWEAGCACRKPRPGMLFEAQRELCLDLTRTWFVGDDERDAQAAERAGCLYAQVGAETTLAGYAAAWLSNEPVRATEDSCAYS